MIDTLPRGGLDNIHTSARIPAGECFFDNETNDLWVYGCADVDIVQGEAVRSKYLAERPNHITAGDAPANSHRLEDTGYFTEATFARVPRDGAPFRQNALISVYSGTGKGQRGVITEIVNNDSIEVYWYGQSQGLLGTALDATSDYQIIIPWLFVKATENDGVAAFAQWDIDQGEYGWFKVEGDGLSLAGGAIVANRELAIAATAGRVETVNVAAGDANTTLTAVGMAYGPAASGDTVFSNLNANMRVKKVPDVGKLGSYQQSYKHPTL